MTVKEFENSAMYKEAARVEYFDVNGVNISNKSPIILDLLQVIGTCHNTDESIDVDVYYTE